MKNKKILERDPTKVFRDVRQIPGMTVIDATFFELN